MAFQPDDRRKEVLANTLVLSKIPAFPPVILRTLDLLARDNARTADLVREITSDATISAQVLRTANSALFGPQMQIDTVQHAVVALGFERVQSIVMNVATSNYMRAAFRTEALSKCWRHSVACAFLSQELARAAGLPPERAYTLGLLHDIGRLGLLVGYPDEYNEILAEADRDGVSLLDLEERRFAMDHCEAGRLLTGQWALPQEFAVVAGRHHDPPQGGPFDLLTVVHLACRYADTLGYSAVKPLGAFDYEALKESLPAAARERLPEDSEEFARLIADHIGGDEADALSTPRAGPIVPLVETNEPDGDAVEGECAGLEAELRSRRVAWDFGIVLMTVVVFGGAMLALKYFAGL